MFKSVVLSSALLLTGCAVSGVDYSNAPLECQSIGLEMDKLIEEREALGMEIAMPSRGNVARDAVTLLPVIGLFSIGSFEDLKAREKVMSDRIHEINDEVSVLKGEYQECLLKKS